ncbi:MAG: exo-alpha-sialidase [Acidimicrobiia bacterium]|nr:exo-alpha-sialidase [Acidimicrobiia bacterium]
MTRFRRLAILVALATASSLIMLTGVSQAALEGRFGYAELQRQNDLPPLSGSADPTITAGADLADAQTQTDAVTATPAVASDDVQVNGDNKANPTDQYGSGEGLPQNETSIAVNPLDPNIVAAAANDYEPGVDGVQGIYMSFDGGHTWPYSRHARQVITPDRRMLGSGDPVVAWDGAGIVYQSFISFGRADCDSYIAVTRSPDNGVTWTYPADADSVGTLHLVGDGIVAHNGGPDDCQIFHDKEWMTAGLRPEGVPLVEGSDPAYVGSDRLYVTWTRFDFDTGGVGYLESPIYLAYSDDQGRHWSEPQEISGSASFCSAQFGDQDANACDESQFSVPVVDPNDGTLYVAFENFNVSSLRRNQLLMVASTDGGQTFAAPERITTVFDGPLMYPVCLGRQTLDDMCARTPGTFGFDIDPNTSRLHVAWFDNRNGSAADTNGDVFTRYSDNGGNGWSPIVNITKESEVDQFFPWLSVNPNGVVAIVYYDRQFTYPLIDTSLAVSTNGGTSYAAHRVSEVSWDPDLAFRLGIFIGDYNAVDTTETDALPFWTDARFAEPNTPGNNPPHQQSDVMVDVEPLP